MRALLENEMNFFFSEIPDARWYTAVQEVPIELKHYQLSAAADALRDGA